MTHDEMIAVIQAHKEGKTIQWKHKTNPDAVDWKDAIELSPEKWDFRDYDYRIKPEPHYRPFKTADEVMEAIKEHGSWLEYNTIEEGVHRVKILEYYKKGYVWVRLYDKCYKAEQLFPAYKFVDGTLFGVKEG